MHRRISAALHRLALASLLFTISMARAASTGDVTEETCLKDPECFTHYQTARQLSKAGDSRGALDEYRIAYQRIPAARLLYSMARLQHKLGQSKDALASYQRFLDTAPALDDELRVKAREYRAEIERELAPPQPALVEKPASASDPAARPVYKKWWFWTILGGVAAAGAVAVGVGVAYSREPGVPRDAQSYMPMF